MTEIILTFLTGLFFFLMSQLTKYLIRSMKKEVAKESLQDPKTDATPQDINNLKYFRRILMQSKNNLHSADDVDSVMDCLIEQCEQYAFGHDEWKILYRMNTQISQKDDLKHAEQIFDKAIKQSKYLVKQYSPKIENVGRNAPKFHIAIFYVSFANIFAAVDQFANPILANINMIMTGAIVAGLLIGFLGRVFFGSRSRMITFSIDLSMISATIMLANSLIAIPH